MRKRSVAYLVAAVIVGVAAAGTAWQIGMPAGPAPRTAAAAAPTVAPIRPPAGAQTYAIDPQASAASYHVGETFFRNNQFKVAVGATHAIQGDIFVDLAHPNQSRVSPITINVNQLTSDSRRRDNAIRSRWLESDTYPTAVFTPTSIQGLPATYAAGQTAHVTIAGNLTVHNVMKPVVFAGTVRLSGDMLTGDVTSTVSMTDFGFDPPSIMMLQTENRAVLDLQFTAHPASAG